MSDAVESFLTATQEEEIVAAIRQAERLTSGEIRVHLERTCTGDALNRAQELFFHLNMDHTKEHNGVLIYIAVDTRKFAVIGDSGIHKMVGDSFWQGIRDAMVSRFRESDYTTGIIDAIQLIGTQLSTHYPWNEDDVNELPDQISKS